VPSDPGWTASPICSRLICGRHRAAKQLLYLGSIRATLKRKCFLAGKIRTARHTKIKFNGFGGQRTYLGFRHSGRRRAMHINLTGNVDLPELRIPDSKLRTK
jgi:hypothetical protein